MELLLSDEEMQSILLKVCGDISCSEKARELWRAIAQAQLKRVVEWSDEICHEHRPYDQRKADCYECWQQIKEGI